MPTRSRDQWVPNPMLQAAREQVFGGRTPFARAVKRRCEQRFGGHCGVDHRKVRRWEEGESVPDIYHQQVICEVLEVPWDERERLGFAVPDRSGREAEVASGVVLVNEQCPVCAARVTTAELGAGSTENEECPTNRGEFLRGGAAGVVSVATSQLQRLASVLDFPVKDRPAASARAVADALSATYTTATTADLFGPVRQHLSRVVHGLGEVMLPRERAELLVVGVDMACLCGWLARSAGGFGDAYAYCALAVDLAEASAQPELMARAFGSQSILKSTLYVPSSVSGNPTEALELLDRAMPGAEAGVFRAWLAVRKAEEHAVRGERDACLRHLESAQSELGRGDGSGLFSVWGLFVGGGETYLAWRRGRCLALLGRAEPALAELSAADDCGSARRAALIQADIGLAWVVAGQPEPGCEAVMRSLDVCEATSYVVGIQRIREVRARFPKTWTPLACVRELDERLGMAA